VCDDQSLSYQELNSRANRLAHHLIGLGVGPDQRVALCAERSIDIVVGLLAILKAGGAYLPLDPGYPRQRLEQTLADSDATLLLADAVGRQAIGEETIATITIIDFDPNEICTWNTCPDTNPQVLGLNSRHVAYVIYTSGSTGIPKGVMVEHTGIINLAQAQIALLKLSSSSRILQFASIGFDASIFDIVMAFGSGATLYLLNENDRHSATGFSNYLSHNRITHATLPPALLKGQVELESLSKLTTLVLAGEEPSSALICAIDKKVSVFNAYGPTEDTVWTTAWLRPDDFNGTVVPIGRPISNTRIYLLDPHGVPVPLGVTGELYIGGAGVARGYLNRPALTAERFIDSPFVPGDRLYRTGDLARYLPDGNIEYLGRTDHQVKIRGFRIELGEIEACLLRDQSLAQAVVIAREDRPGHKQLVAYVVPASGLGVDGVDTEALRQTLAKQLPDYMVPAAIVSMAHLPLTPNGKLDRRELPVPDFAVSVSRDPRTPQEEILAGLFAEVLGLDRVGVDDSFFNLGGHSLLATRLISRMRSTLHVEIAIPTLFNAPTVAQLALRLDGGGVVRPRLQAMPHPGRIPLSFPQQRLWFLHQFEGPSPTYNIPTALHLRGTLHTALLEAALRDLVARHESLRTLFNEEDGNPYQDVLPVEAADLRLICQDVDAASLQAAIDAAVGYAFDISTEIPVRACLLRLSADEAVLVLLVHHIASDGASLAPLARDLSIAYAAHCQGQAPDWVPLPVQYADFTLWQRALLGLESDSHSTVSRQIAFWKQRLAGLPELINLPTDHPRPIRASHRGDACDLKIDARLYGELVALARQSNASLFMVLHAALALLLSRLGAGSDIVLGTPVAGRTDEVLDDLVGFFVNVLVLRTDVSGNPSFRQLLKRVCDTNLEAYAHQDLPFERLVDIVSPTRSTAHHPLFQVMLVLQNQASAMHHLHDLDVSPQPVATQVSKFDLTFDFSTQQAADGSAQGLHLRLEYATDLFERATVQRFGCRLLQLLESITQQADQPVAAFDLLSSEERTLLLDTWNRTEIAYPQDRCLHELFEDQVRSTPNATALVCDDQSLSYQELNSRANRLAHHLIGMGVGPERLVAIALPRSLDLVVTILAVLKAGGAYLPLDPEYPAERLTSIIDDAKPDCILTCASVADNLSAGSELVILDSQEISRALSDSPTRNPDNSDRVGILLALHPAYVIFTSGSTGRPKGVMIPHQNVVRLFSNTEHWFGFNEHDVWTLFHSYAFDFSVWELWGPLLYGGKLVVVPYLTSRTPAEFLALLARERVTVLNQTPSAFYQLMQADADHPEFSTRLALRYVIFGGEMLDPARLNSWYSRHADNSPKLINMYGITETTVHVTYLPLDATCVNWASRSMVGPQIPNLHVYVLNDALQLVPIGVPGELYVAGYGLARGYLNRASLSAERFVANPFDQTGQRMYRTGDVVRWMPDGNIEYLGRSDHQVKIRGFRIELGEIEACLLRDQSVGQAVVIAREDRPGDKQLVGYVVPASDLSVDTESLRRALTKQLPDHMVPAAIVLMENLPLTPNGKLDRKGLPAPERHAFARQAYEAPQGDVEKILAEFWQDLLGIKQVGRRDNFFQLGGHSLLALQLMARLRNRGLIGGIRELFASPVLSDLALTLQYHNPVTIPPNRIRSDSGRITPDMLPLIELTQTDIDRITSKVPGGIANIQDIYALTPLQEGILFHHLLATHNDPYLLATRMMFAERNLLDRYLGAVQKVVDRHDILRTAFMYEGLTASAQVVLRKAPLIVEEIKLDSEQKSAFEQLEQRVNLARYRLNLAEAPLLRFIVAQEPGTNRWLVLSLQHHLTDDRTSLDIQNAEIQAFILGQGETLTTPTSFRNLIAQIQSGTSAEASERFFRDTLADIDEPTAPFGLVDVHGDGSEMRESRLMLAQSLGDRLRAQAKRLGVTLASLCHFAWGQVIARTSGRRQVVFGTVLFGRTNAGADGAMGPFINTLPLRLDLDDIGVEDAVRLAHAGLSDLLQRAHASLAMAQRCSGVVAPTPLFSALLNYRHNRMSDLDVTDSTTIEDATHPWYGIEWLGGEERTNYPFTMSIDDFEQALQLTAKVAQPHAPERICALMQRALEQLADALETAPATPAFQLDALPLEERTLLLNTWNRTEANYPQDCCIHELFESQVNKAPNATALVLGNTSLTYAQLNSKANRLAHLLIARGVNPESVVAIALPKSFNLIVAMLGVLKAGGAYLPLDPGYPAEHLNFMLSDASPRLVLTTRETGSSFGDCAPLLYLDELEQSTVPVSSHEVNPTNAQRLCPLHVQHPAYVIYTSGSTGKPKGAVILHQGLVNHMARSIDAYYDGNNGDDGGSPLVLSTSFDGSVTALYGPLLTGQPLTLLESGRELDSLLSGRADSKTFAVLKITPSHLKLLHQTREPASPLPSTRTLIVGGEALSGRDVLSWKQRQPAIRIVNQYGPTETTVGCCTFEATGPLDDEKAVPIGRPIWNTQVYVLDDRLQPVPIGAPGELYIAGHGLARGYLKRPAMTAARFIANPFGSAGSRMYRSGDLVRWVTDGNLEFLGRTDHQIKLRGFRIELGEIEAHLCEHPAIAQAAVLVQENSNGDKRLIAYVVAIPQSHTSPSDLSGVLRSDLSEHLPDYMVPVAFVCLDQLPLTPSGKLDRKALPGVDEQSFARRPYESPQGEIEETVASVWENLLGIQKVSRHDNFFELGGHSLLAVRLLGRLQGEFGVRIELSTLFDYPDLASFAKKVLISVISGEFDSEDLQNLLSSGAHSNEPC
jgi:amino acid adenylation domain-containing protein